LGRDEHTVNLEPYQFLIPRLWPDVVEILLVAFVIYRFLLFLVGTRAMQIVVGVMILSVAYFLSLLAKFTMISTLLAYMFTFGAFAAVVVFQPELRNALARLGQSRLMRRFSQSERQSVAEEIAEALDRLSRAGTGAIIAVEGDIGLEEFISSGVPMEAKVSADLLTTIFTPYSPLHDGAVLVRGDRIIGAGCVLPLTQFKVADKSLGTRHRAALGLSEETDATVLVVSEETSTISIASHGLLHRHLTAPQVRDLLSGAISHLEGGERVSAPAN
jgi:diadenylate cyclase